MERSGGSSSERIFSARLRATPTTPSSFRVGEDRGEQLSNPVGPAQVTATGLVVDEQRFHRGVPQRDELEALGLGEQLEVDVPTIREVEQLAKCRLEFADQFRLVPDDVRTVCSVRACGVHSEGRFEVTEHADVVDDETVLLVGEHPVRSCDRLHERVIAHGPIEVDRRARRHVESGHPHRTHEHETERVVRVLEPLVEVFVEHSLPVWRDVETELGEISDLVLCLRHDDGHVGRLHERNLCVDSSAFEFGKPRRSLAQLTEVYLPLLGHEVVHADRGRLIDGHEHRLTQETATDEVANEIGGNPSQTLRSSEELVLGSESAGESTILCLVEFGPFEDRCKLLLETLVLDLQFGDAVLVVEGDGGAVLNRVAEVIGRDVVAEDLAGALLVAGDERGAGESEEAGVG